MHEIERSDIVHSMLKESLVYDAYVEYSVLTESYACRSVIQGCSIRESCLVNSWAVDSFLRKAEQYGDALRNFFLVEAWLEDVQFLCQTRVLPPKTVLKRVDVIRHYWLLLNPRETECGERLLGSLTFVRPKQPPQEETPPEGPERCFFGVHLVKSRRQALRLQERLTRGDPDASLPYVQAAVLGSRGRKLGRFLLPVIGFRLFDLRDRQEGVGLPSAEEVLEWMEEEKRTYERLYPGVPMPTRNDLGRIVSALRMTRVCASAVNRVAESRPQPPEEDDETVADPSAVYVRLTPEEAEQLTVEFELRQEEERKRMRTTVVF